MTPMGAGWPLKKLGVIGYPIGHSVSPVFQQAALDALRIPWTYEAYEVAPEDLPRFVEGARGEEWRGFNVTIPHKVAIIPLLDVVEPIAAALGTVNTVLCGDGQAAGCSTDGPGFSAAVTREGESLEGERAVVLGTGGTARAVVGQLLEEGAASVAVLGRSPARLEELRAAMLVAFPAESSARLVTLPWTEDALAGALPRATLLANTTPVGMRGGGAEGRSAVPARLLHPGLTLFDAVYDPVETPLLAAARRAGARPVSGLRMLLFQGAIAFGLWTDEEAPQDVMHAAIMRELRRLR